MKKLLTFLATIFILTSCGSTEDNESNVEEQTNTGVVIDSGTGEIDTGTGETIETASGETISESGELESGEEDTETVSEPQQEENNVEEQEVDSEAEEEALDEIEDLFREILGEDG